ncbi:30S ribosome-binding factor RbfA [Marinibactrum halimedae]|uniref:Ribosome-binding factor A n=1 Tax=Marinibactrum halimedae TaxID=1444977 RepID=A0AA37WP55_9GAMM|nr:30S ribosome-binding factor RbfA [Marinibactrum halimedae]MCD9458999.1 30S ribosome-binding factor RbfA [Marinibactrum halimedae]GLS26871.1 ribosome-binding factor A [Marinibactrum halimedae]
MAKDFNRTDRISDAMQRILAQAMQQEIRDPRIGMVNINDVSVTRDLSLAKVYVTFVGKESDLECHQAEKALNKASGFLRSIVAKELDLRITPRLQFLYDKTSIRGQELSSLIDRAVKADKNHQSSDED